MSPRLDSLRRCFEGVIPSCLATASPEGTPNATYISQVQYVDERHIALTFQFFNKTRRNILANPFATLRVVDPVTGALYRLDLRYLRTETSGPLFESMKAKLAGIASHTGMSGVFFLRGADIYEVEAIEQLYHPPAPPTQANLLPLVRRASDRMSRCAELSDLFDTALAVLAEQFGIDHAMILKLDENGGALFTVASRGYSEAGIGSEIPLGHGVIGVSARERTPIRISHMTNEYAYGKAVLDSAAASGFASRPETAIPMPGLAECRSQMAVPILAASQLYGVLYVESPVDLRFGYDEEDSLQLLACQLGWMAHSLTACAEAAEAAGIEEEAAPPAEGRPLRIRYFAADSSVFLDDDYLIKGVAGSIFWTLAQAHEASGRRHFTNRELRLNASLGLPDYTDNLEARLVLLTRRLDERGAGVHLRKTGRGRFELATNRPFLLEKIEA